MTAATALGFAAAIATTVWAFAPLGSAPVEARANFDRVRVPNERMSEDRLQLPSLAHQQLLVIDQDGLHSNEKFEIVLDGWSDAKRSEIADVRLWWLNTGNRNERRPFSARVRRHIDVDYTAENAESWRVKVGADKKDWAFDVELDNAGQMHAYAGVRTAGGIRVEHCRTKSSRMVPKRTLGLVTGVDRIEVVCVDDDGRTHRGSVEPSRGRRR